MHRWFTRIFCAVAGAVLLVGLSDQAVLAAPVVPQNLQALVVSNGQLFHALRYSSDGAWNGFNSVAGWAKGVPASIDHVASAVINGNLHVIVTTTEPHAVGPAQVYHAIRYANGAWTSFNNVSGWANVPPTDRYLSIAAANVNGDLHVVLVTAVGHGALYHAIRYSSTGAWNGFNSVYPHAYVPGPVTSVAAAGVNGVLHVLLIAAVPTPGSAELYHAIRYPDGTWNGFNKLAYWATIPTRTVGAVAAAGVNQDLQVVITADGYLYHAIRYSRDGAWNGFNSLDGHAAVPPTVGCVAAAGVKGNLQVLLSANGGLWHAMRYTSTGYWNGFNSLVGRASIPNSISDCAAAG